MTRSPAAEASRPTGQPLSRQDQPLRDLMLAARRQRGLLLSRMVSRVASKVFLAFAMGRRSGAARHTRINHPA